MALFWKRDFVGCSPWSTTMKGFEHSELVDWDDPLSSIPYNSQSLQDVPSTSIFKSTSSANPTPASYSSSTSSQDANADCYIIDVSSSIDDLFDENCGSTRASIKVCSRFS